LGALLGGAVNKAHMTLEIRIVNAATSEILAFTRAIGQAANNNKAALTDFFGKKDLPPDLSVYKDTPMETAIRNCVNEAVRQIAQAVPADYYKY
jgi:curli biogenesis system outer membrane secretion channel CsgG